MARVVAKGKWRKLRWPSKTLTAFQQNFTPYQNVIMPTVRGAKDEDTTRLAEAFRAYDQNQFAKAGQYFGSLPKDATTLLYSGNCYLAEKKFDEAAKAFQELLAEYDIFDEQAEWFLALSYLGKNDMTNSIQSLNQIIKRKASYSSRATKLLSDLNQSE